MDGNGSTVNGHRKQRTRLDLSGEIELQTSNGQEKWNHISEDGISRLNRSAEDGISRQDHTAEDGTSRLNQSAEDRISRQDRTAEDGICGLNHSAEDDIRGQVAESGKKKQENGSLKPKAPEKFARRKTRKERTLENWALTEAEPNACRTCGLGCGLCSWCCWNGSFDSLGSPLAAPADIFDIFHHSRLILGAYGSNVDDLEKLIKAHDTKFDKKAVVKFGHPNVEHDNCPPFFISVDDARREVGLYVRGLNLLHKSDYAALMSNRKHELAFQGGYMHEGMAKAAEWCMTHVVPDLREQLLKHKGYRLTLVGHSLGAGVCALLTAIILESRDTVGGIDSHLIRAYAFAPPRVMSLDLAKRYAPNIYSVIYQDDFLSRISTASVKKVFAATFALTGGVLFLYWLKQQMMQRPAKKDIYRLYPPGRIFHVVYRQPGVCHDMPVQVRMVDSAEGRFERIVLSSSGTAMDHSVLKLAKHLKSYDWPPEFRDKI